MPRQKSLFDNTNPEPSPDPDPPDECGQCCCCGRSLNESLDNACTCPAAFWCELCNRCSDHCPCVELDDLEYEALMTMQPIHKPPTKTRARK